MFEPLRFLHVADAGLDRPLRDLGAISENAQPFAEEATLIAFEQMIEGAITQNVDFVLLAGNTFREADYSLRARLALQDGLERLYEFEIDVFVLPGFDDPEQAWRDIPDLPSNVTLLTADEEEESPIAIVRDGRVIATVTAGTLSQLSARPFPDVNPESSIFEPVSEQDGPPRFSPFRIGMLTAWPAESFEGEDLGECLSGSGCDYLAVPQSDSTDRRNGWHFEAGQTLNTDAGIAHHPGRLQALSSHETGPHGATLIEVDETGEIRGTFLPFACARRLRFEVPIASDAALEDIADAMSRQLAEETEQPGELIWFVRWILQGSGDSFDLLRDPEFQSELLELLPGSLGPNGTSAVHHQLQFQESPARFEAEETFSDLERLYHQALEKFSEEDPALSEFLSNAALSEIAPLDDPLKPLVADLNSEAILARASLLGREWFREES